MKSLLSVDVPQTCDVFRCANVIEASQRTSRALAGVRLVILGHRVHSFSGGRKILRESTWRRRRRARAIEAALSAVHAQSVGARCVHAAARYLEIDPHYAGRGYSFSAYRNTVRSRTHAFPRGVAGEAGGSEDSQTRIWIYFTTAHFVFALLVSCYYPSLRSVSAPNALALC